MPLSTMSSSMSTSLDYPYRQQHSSAVLRRGQPFFMAVRMKERSFDPRRDILRVVFTFGALTLIGFLLNLSISSFLQGPNPQVTKGTKVVLPFRTNQREFTRAPQKWDLRLHQQEGSNVTFQVP